MLVCVSLMVLVRLQVWPWGLSVFEGSGRAGLCFASLGGWSLDELSSVSTQQGCLCSCCKRDWMPPKPESCHMLVIDFTQAIHCGVFTNWTAIEYTERDSRCVSELIVTCVKHLFLERHTKLVVVMTQLCRAVCIV